MNRIVRMLAITGMGLVAGVTIGAGPAMAATNTDQGAAKPASAATAARGTDRVVDYFDTRGECYSVGHQGEQYGRWDDFDCVPRGGDWALVVDYSDWHGGWPGHGWPGHGGWPGHHHGWVGSPFHHGPGHHWHHH